MINLRALEKPGITKNGRYMDRSYSNSLCESLCFIWVLNNELEEKEQQRPHTVS